MNEMTRRVARAMDEAGAKFVADNPDGSNDDLMAALSRAAIEAVRASMVKIGIGNDDKAGCVYELIDEALR